LVVPKAPVWKPELDGEGEEREGRLSEGDVQMFEKENSELLRGYDEHLDQVSFRFLVVRASSSILVTSTSLSLSSPPPPPRIHTKAGKAHALPTYLIQPCPSLTFTRSQSLFFLAR